MMLTVKDVAQRLSLSATNVYQLISSGQLPHPRFGIGRGTIRVSEADLSAFINLNRRGEKLPAAEVEQPRRVRALKHLRLNKQGK